MHPLNKVADAVSFAPNISSLEVWSSENPNSEHNYNFNNSLLAPSVELTLFFYGIIRVNIQMT